MQNVALPALSSVRLGAFKSYHAQELNLGPLTLIVGRNASGKSNALDALSLLALLADERDVSDLERGDQEVAGIRGGLSGAAPFGEERVRVGCTIATDDDDSLELDLELDATDRPEIISEKLVLHRKRGTELVLIDAHRQAKGAGIVSVQWVGRSSVFGREVMERGSRGR